MKLLISAILYVLCLSVSAHAADFKLRCEVKKVGQGFENAIPVVLEQTSNFANSPQALINKFRTDQSGLPFDLTVGASETMSGVGIEGVQVHVEGGGTFSFNNSLGAPRVVGMTFGVNKDNYRVDCSIRTNK